MRILCAVLTLTTSLLSMAKEADPPAYITDSMLNSYVTQLQQRLPVTGPDGTKMLSVNRQGRTIIYGMKSLDSINQQTADFMFNSQYRNMLCQQSAESFWLKRKVNLTWNYFDKRGRFLATATITPSDCKY